MPINIEITSSRLLLVEGKDTLKFFEAAHEKMGSPGIQILDFGGIKELLSFLGALKVNSGFIQLVKSIGIVRDAELDAKAAFASVCGSLQRVKLPVPRRPGVAVDGPPRVNVLILPDNTNPGMLEDLCLGSVADAPVISCIDEFFACVQKRQGYIPGNKSKAKLRVFLASRKDPTKLPGNALKADYIPWKHPHFDHIKRFLEDLLKSGN